MAIRWNVVKITGMISSGALTVHPEQYGAYLDNVELEFTPKEFELLVYFMQNKNRVLSRDQLLSAVWNYDFAGDTRIVDVHVSHLREKIEENTKKPTFIKTVRGIGYKFEEQKGMRKGLYSRLVIACAVLLSVLLTGLGIVLGQFFPLFAENSHLTLQRQYWIFLILTLAIAFVLSLFIAARMMLQYARPIDDMTKIASQIAHGDYLQGYRRVNRNMIMN